MANTKSALKRIKKNNLKRLQKKVYFKYTRTLIKNLNKKDIKNKINKLSSLIDRLVNKKIIHKNKSNRLKSKLLKTLIL
ncbi:MAG: 30S ribosomal protein S20 [Candidatus Karelsulcia muelleri]|uniref:30S ribosomal protein S20 n=1 Tax=Candidatus Karelsulcia muelleri TaxID=336810 RepID=UPI000D7BF212|nr:30S ribosomal protein S20 [Candidatus Karelsulcia muelleri]